MLKNILKLNGAQELSKADQKAISGGIHRCPPHIICGGTGFDPIGYSEELCLMFYGFEWYCGQCYACH